MSLRHFCCTRRGRFGPCVSLAFDLPPFYGARHVLECQHAEAPQQETVVHSLCRVGAQQDLAAAGVGAEPCRERSAAGGTPLCPLGGGCQWKATQEPATRARRGPQRMTDTRPAGTRQAAGAQRAAEPTRRHHRRYRREPDTRRRRAPGLTGREETLRPPTPQAPEGVGKGLSDGRWLTTPRLLNSCRVERHESAGSIDDAQAARP